MAIEQHIASRRGMLGFLATAPLAACGAAPAFAATSSEWANALADYQAKRAYSDALPLESTNVDDAVDAYCKAMDRLIEKVPAPNLAAVGTKLDLAMERCEDFGMITEYYDAIRVDVRRLGSN